MQFIYTWVGFKLCVTLSDIMSLNILLLNANFDKCTVGLHFLLISSMLKNFQGDQRSIIISSLNILLLDAYPNLIYMLISSNNAAI